jgi:hypothetical protein
MICAEAIADSFLPFAMEFFFVACLAEFKLRILFLGTANETQAMFYDNEVMTLTKPMFRFYFHRTIRKMASWCLRLCGHFVLMTSRA